MLRWKRLALEINVGSKVDDLPDRPTESDPDDASENAHGACLREEKSLHVTIAGADRFHNANLAAAFEDRHHQGIYDPDESHSQGKAAEDSQKNIQHLEEMCIRDRRRIGR